MRLLDDVRLIKSEVLALPTASTLCFGETRFEVKVKCPNLSQWNITVLSIASLVQLAIGK